MREDMSGYMAGWADVLKAATPVDAHTPAPRAIYETWERKSNGGRTYQALTPQEYKDFRKTHWWWNGSIKKLSLDEIATTSLNYFQHYRVQKNELLMGIKRRAMCEKIEGVDAEKNIIETVTQCLDSAPIKSIVESLRAMSQRATQKHTVEKTQSIWGKIKWMVWTYLYDSTALIARVISNQPSIDHTDFFKKANQTLQERVIMNMTWFEESVHYLGSTEHPRTGVDSEADLKRYPTPRDVQKKWIAHFAEDKFHIPELAVQANFPHASGTKAKDLVPAMPSIKEYERVQAIGSRVRIYAMLNIWNHIVKLNEEQANALAERPRHDAASSGTLLLES